jgi:hypothetical protein
MPPFALRKAAFYSAIHGLLRRKTWPFESRLLPFRIKVSIFALAKLRSGSCNQVSFPPVGLVFAGIE